MNLAVVYLGKKVPTYVFRNLLYLKKTFPAETVYFISDNEGALNEASEIGVKIFKACLTDEKSKVLKERLSHPMGFRDGFWLHTTSRFFAILEFSHYLNEPFIQVEADVFLFKSFPIHKIEEFTKISFPLETPSTGAASIFYVPSNQSISEFVSFILEMTDLNSRETDMTLLGKYWAKYPEKVMILPSIARSEPAGELESAVSAASRELDRFQGLFDPLTYGMHLLGEDPMNARGWVKFGKKPHNHLISELNLRFELKDGSLFLIQKENRYEIFCLHVHSKNLRMFRGKSFSREIHRGIKFASREESRFMPKVFLRLAGKSLVRRYARAK